MASTKTKKPAAKVDQSKVAAAIEVAATKRLSLSVDNINRIIKADNTVVERLQANQRKIAIELSQLIDSIKKCDAVAICHISYYCTGLCSDNGKNSAYNELSRNLLQPMSDCDKGGRSNVGIIQGALSGKGGKLGNNKNPRCYRDKPHCNWYIGNNSLSSKSNGRVFNVSDRWSTNLAYTEAVIEFINNCELVKARKGKKVTLLAIANRINDLVAVSTGCTEIDVSKLS